MASLHQPHDHLFRLVFADPEETAAFLRARLPDSYQRGILWSSLRGEPAHDLASTPLLTFPPSWYAWRHESIGRPGPL